MKINFKFTPNVIVFFIAQDMDCVAKLIICKRKIIILSCIILYV